MNKKEIARLQLDILDLRMQLSQKEAKLGKLQSEAYLTDLQIREGEIPIAQHIADLLHKNTCSWNHIDGCGYYYSDWNKPCSARQRELERVEKMIQAIMDNSTVAISYNEAARQLLATVENM